MYSMKHGIYSDRCYKLKYIENEIFKKVQVNKGCKGLDVREVTSYYNIENIYLGKL